MKKTTAAFAATGMTALLVLAAPLTAGAHVGVTPDSASADGSTVLTFAVGHGCEGSPTTALTFTIPEEVAAVKPTAKAGWQITVSDTAITYTADAPLADGIRDTVELQVSLDAAAPEGTQIAFPVLQSCVDGETDWSMVAAEGEDAHDLDAPAPVITVGAATVTDHHGAVAGSGEGHGEDGEAAAAPDASDGTAPWVIAIAASGLVLGLFAFVLALLATVRLRRRGGTA